MKTILYLIIMLILSSYAVGRAFSGISAGVGMEYNPIAKLTYPNSGAEYEIVDNVTWEPGIYYNFATGFRTGTFLDYYSKTFDPGGTIAKSKLSSWGIGLLGDYAYEMTVSGRTLLIGGMEIGYGEFTDDNENARRTGGSVWIAGIGGLRYYFTPSFSMELDYRIKWHQYDLSGEPAKSYDFSGSTVRISVGYSLYSSDRKGDNSGL